MSTSDKPEAPSVTESMRSYTAVYDMVSQNSDALLKTLKTSILIIVSLALTQALPLFPLDGGRILVTMLKKRISEKSPVVIWVKSVGALFLLLLIFMSMLSDIIWIIK